MIKAHGTQTALDVLLEIHTGATASFFRNAGGPVRTRLTGRADLKQQLFEVVVDIMCNRKVG